MEINKKKILVINLTRMGDIIQSTPLLRTLKHRDANAEISYLAVSGFSETCRLIPEIDRLVTFNFNAAVAVSKDAIKHLPKRVAEMDEFINSLQVERYDEIINLSHSRHSALMTYLIDRYNTRGITLNSEGYRMIKHPWARYFFIANLNRHYNRINLVDINQGLALDIGEFEGLSQPMELPFGRSPLSLQLSDEADQTADNLLRHSSTRDDSITIGFQPGASLDCKRWPTDSFVQLGHLLKKNYNASVIIFGSQGEANLTSAIKEQLGDMATDLAGKTDIPTLAACLKKLDLLVTNDTGTQHLAAAVGTPVLSLCFGNALSHETGPYGRGHVVMESTIPCFPCSFHVECHRFRCQESVTPEAVFYIVNEMRKSPELTDIRIDDEALFKDIHVWRTDFEKDGFWALRPLIRRTLTAADAISLTSRSIWKEFLTEHNPDEQEKTEDADLFETIFADYLPPDMNKFQMDLSETLKTLKRMSELALDGQTHCDILMDAAHIAESRLEFIKATGEDLDKIDREIALTGYRLPPVNHLILDFMFNKQNLEGYDLYQLTNQSRKNYQRLYSIALRFLTNLNRMVQVFKETGWTTHPENESSIANGPILKKMVALGNKQSEPFRELGERP